jgi:hypothetical protein
MPPMAWGALSLAIVSFLFIGLGVLFTPVPGVGAAFAFTAPLLALAGIILGGRAVTQSKAAPVGDGTTVAHAAQGSGLALAAVIASAIAFVPAVITALTCGACNALCATGNFKTQQHWNTSSGTVDPFDVLRRSGALGPSDGDAGVAVPDAPQPSADAGAGQPTALPLPPPPIAPGPRP